MSGVLEECESDDDERRVRLLGTVMGEVDTDDEYFFMLCCSCDDDDDDNEDDELRRCVGVTLRVEYS